MNRSAALIEQAKLAKNEGIIIHNPSNMFYLSGYRGEGLVALADGVTAIVTDSRYTEQAGREAPDYACHEIAKGRGHLKVAAGLFEEKGITLVRYEDDYVTVQSFEEMKKAMPHVEFVPLKGVPERMRKVKDESEIAMLRRACAISCEALDDTLGRIKPGMTEIDIRLMLEFKMFSLGAESLAFSTIVASGPNGSLPHAVPSDRKVQKGDLITMDFGARYKGYCADMTRTVALGRPSDELNKIYHIVLEAQTACFDMLGPGKRCCDIDAKAREIIGNAGYGQYFGHGLGHGVGIDIHEAPSLGYVCEEELVPGHVVTDEPGIYLPGVGGVRIEDSCVITNDGAESLVTAPKELIIL